MNNVTITLDKASATALMKLMYMHVSVAKNMGFDAANIVNQLAEQDVKWPANYSRLFSGLAVVIDGNPNLKYHDFIVVPVTKE